MRTATLLWMGMLAACTGAAPADPALPDPDTLMFTRLDRDGSGRVTVDEIPDREARAVIAAWDADSSGDLDPSEVATAMSGPPPGLPGKKGKARGKRTRR